MAPRAAPACCYFFLAVFRSGFARLAASWILFRELSCGALLRLDVIRLAPFQGYPGFETVQRFPPARLVSVVDDFRPLCGFR